MDDKLTVKNDSKSRRGFLQKVTNLIGGTAIFAAAANLFTSSESKAKSLPLAGTEDFTGTIDMVGFGFAPRDWATCDGQLLAISTNTALFSLIGTTYGGDGRTTFQLPDLRGRVPIGRGSGPGLSNYNWGQTGGTETVTLSTQQIPSHNHSFAVNTAGGTSNSPVNNFLASNSEGIKHYSGSGGSSANNSSIGNTGGSQAHTNMQPYLALYFVICLVGIFPSRN
jgi:microcystin-dependent protein